MIRTGFLIRALNMQNCSLKNDSMKILFLLLTSFSAIAQDSSAGMQLSFSVKPNIQIGDLYGSVSVKDFLAMGDGSSDDYLPIINACNYCLANPKICNRVRFPAGFSYRITKPLLLQNKGRYFTITLTGDFSNKYASDEYLSKIICDYKAGFGIGIQYGRGITIQNLTIIGKYTFPNTVTNQNIGTLKFSDWIDSTITDNGLNPYAGISVDPFQNASGSRGGTSGVTVRDCKIINWMVGIVLSPNGYTQNAEMIFIDNDDIESDCVAIAVCQDQSKTVSITNLKAWSSVHTILDGVHYGAGTGGGSVFCDNWNIAGNVNELFNVTTSRFPLAASRIYSESIFKIGIVSGSAGANFRDFEVDFLSGPGMPAPDYLFYGNATFDGGQLRYYDNSYNHRMNWANCDVHLSNLTLSNPIISYGLYGIPTNHYPTPQLSNVKYFYTTGTDSLFNLPWSYTVTVDRMNWTATINSTGFNIGDYILAAPTNRTGQYYDQALNPRANPTIQIGRVIGTSGGVTLLDDVGLTAYSGNNYDAFYVDRIK